MVVLLPMYHPIRFAEEAAMVDILSDGRLTLRHEASPRKDSRLDRFGRDRTRNLCALEH
jgi:alkanesulfonate monooxygenase SsuD/methylene tetrahydromethanopterin reductase-like flavin-dependent oxidoreductase (luciferase family)